MILVSRFRSSHTLAAPPMRTSESRDTSNFMTLVRHLDLKFLNELAAIMIGTSNPPHWCGFAFDVPMKDSQPILIGTSNAPY